MSRWRSAWCPAAVAVVPTYLLFTGVAVPGGYYTNLMLALVGWSAVGVLWLAAVVRYLGRPFRQWWSLLLTPAVFAASWAVASGDLVGRALFPLHRPGLERLAATPTLQQSAAVGVYAIRTRVNHEGCSFVSMHDPGMSRYAGFAWCPGSDPTGKGWDERLTFERIEGDWYAYHAGRSTRTGSAWGLRLSLLAPEIET